MTMTINLDELKITAKIIEGQDLKAIVSINFGDFIVKGFRIQKSKYKNKQEEEGLWVTPPSYRDSGGKYHPIFFSPDKLLWEQIKNKILEEYSKANNSHYKKRMRLEKDADGISIDDIAF